MAFPAGIAIVRFQEYTDPFVSIAERAFVPPAGETLMTVHGIDHINLRASGNSFAALRDFYCGVLGLEPGPRPPLRSAGLWLYAGEAAIVHLVELPEPEAPGAPSAGPSRLDHVALRCSHLDETLTRLRRLGVEPDINEVQATGQVLLRLEDPAGLRIELVFAPGDPSQDRSA